MAGRTCMTASVGVPLAQRPVSCVVLVVVVVFIHRHSSSFHHHCAIIEFNQQSASSSFFIIIQSSFIVHHYFHFHLFTVHRSGGEFAREPHEAPAARAGENPG